MVIGQSWEKAGDESVCSRGGEGVGGGKVSGWLQKEGWGLAVRAESRSPGCLVVTWVAVLEVRNVQLSVKVGLGACPERYKGKAKGAITSAGAERTTKKCFMKDKTSELGFGRINRRSLCQESRKNI